MSANAAVKVLIVDDHPLFRQGVRFALAVEPDVEVVGDAADAQSAMDWIMKVRPNAEPNVILVDLNLPDMSGLELTQWFRRQYPSIGIVMLSMHENADQAFNALRAGAAAYFSKDIKPKDLAQHLRRVARGEYVINEMVMREPNMANRVLTQFRKHQALFGDSDADVYIPLSDREIEVLELIASGSSNKEIGDQLGISTQTVKNHISSILRKLSLNDRTQAVIYALRRGWIEAPTVFKGSGEPGD